MPIRQNLNQNRTDAIYHQGKDARVPPDAVK